MANIELTQEEINIILKRRKSKERRGIVKKGVLREDLYYLEDDLSVDFDAIYDKIQMDQVIKSFKKSFNILVPKETKFSCQSKRGKEIWSDNDNKYADYTSDWAEKYLTNIQDV